MAHLHLRLFAHRFNEVAEDYLQRVNWIYARVVPEVDNLLRAIHDTCSKQHFVSPRSLVFGEVEFSREILHFFNPVQCCQKTLWNTDTLIVHILHHGEPSGGRDELDDGRKRLAIMFNLYVQLGTSILIRYDNSYEMMEQSTAQLLRKAADYLSCIRNKPVRRDVSAADTFAQGTFAKWKYVFDYTCRTCCNTTGIENCRYEAAIAWFKVHQITLVVNPIRHLGTKVHAANTRNVLPDHIVPAINQPRQEPLETLEINNNSQWSKAATYLLKVRESELDKLCVAGAEIQRSTTVETIRRFLEAKLGPLLTNMSVEPFGSRVTGVADRQSDLDLRITSDMEEKSAYLKAWAWAKATSEVELRRMIPTGPMLLTIHALPPIDLTLDLTFASPYIVANSALIEYFFRLQPMARKLFFLLKEWKQQTNLSLKFHHHIIIMMIVFHMQQERYLPPIVSLLVGPVLLNDNTYNTVFAESTTLFQRPTNLLTLLGSFFAYWSQFNWAKNGACMSDGLVRPKESFRFARKSVPPMMASDYFDQSRNIAGNIQTGDHQKFVQACKEAVEVLKMKKSI